MKPTVYIETSVISYLTSRPSRDLIAAARQARTFEWWERHAPSYALYISDAVIDEVSNGDENAAKSRLERIAGIPVLEVTEEAIVFAGHIAHTSGIPPKATIDALHVAVAALNGMEHLLTWNCKHLANVNIRRRVRIIVEDAGFSCPDICTPEELLENYP